MLEAIRRIQAVLSSEHVCLWPLIKPQLTEPHERNLYEFKRCSCGAVMVKRNGPMGDREWGRIDDLKQAWVKERCEAAIAKTKGI